MIPLRAFLMHIADQKSGKCEILAQNRLDYVKINLENSTNYVKNAYKIMRICDLQIANSTNY